MNRGSSLIFILIINTLSDVEGSVKFSNRKVKGFTKLNTAWDVVNETIGTALIFFNASLNTEEIEQRYNDDRDYSEQLDISSKVLSNAIEKINISFKYLFNLRAQYNKKTNKYMLTQFIYNVLRGQDSASGIVN